MHVSTRAVGINHSSIYALVCENAQLGVGIGSHANRR
jgi:hypothetical protein